MYRKSRRFSLLNCRSGLNTLKCWSFWIEAAQWHDFWSWSLRFRWCECEWKGKVRGRLEGKWRLAELGMIRAPQDHFRWQRLREFTNSGSVLWLLIYLFEALKWETIYSTDLFDSLQDHCCLGPLYTRGCQEPWPWNCESPKESVQRPPSQHTSQVMYTKYDI
jgi:hypothetical protein